VKALAKIHILNFKTPFSVPFSSNMHELVGNVEN